MPLAGYLVHLLFFQCFKGEGQAAEGEQTPAQAQAPAPEEKPQTTPVKTPKSPAKSEPQTPSKKVKEIPPIPTFELYMVLAAGN